MPQHDCLHFMPNNTSSPFSLVLHCPGPTHSLTSALHHCLDFMMTFSCSYLPHVDRIHDLHLFTLFTFPFLFVILPFLYFFHLFFLLRVCLPISDPISSDHSASPSTQAYLISHIPSHIHVYIPSQELPITSVVPTSTSNVGEHSQFDHFFRFSFPSIHPHPHWLSHHPRPPSPHLPKRPDIIINE